LAANQSGSRDNPFHALTLAILAAGRSTRFGANKLEQPLAGLPVGLHVAQTAAGLPFRHRVAVCAPGASIGGGFERFGFGVQFNPNPQEGISGSLAIAGRLAQRGGSDGLLICLADMPLVDAALLRSLAECWATDPSKPIVTVGTNYRGPPTILAAALLPKLATLTGDRGARDLLATARTLSAPDAKLIDIDRPDDLAKLIADSELPPR